MPRHCWLLAVVVLVVQLWAETAYAETAAERVVRVAFDRALPPFSFVDEHGEARGFTVELIRSIADVRGFRLEFVPLDWEDAVDQLARGEVDVILGMEYTASRDRMFDFSESFFTMSDVLLVPREDTSIHHLNDLKGKTVAVQRDSTGIDLLNSVRRVNMLVTFNQLDALANLQLGRADAFLGNPWTVRYVLEAQGLEEQFVARSGLINPTDYAFAVREGNYELLQEINSGLQEVMREGTHGRLYSRYFDPFSEQIAGWWRKLVWILLVLTGGIALVLLFSFLWNKRLQQEVQRQTTALADSLAFQSQVLNSVDSAIFSFDLNGRITLRNQLTLHLLGMGDDALGRNVADYLPELQVQQVIEKKQPLIRGEIARHEEKRGKIRYFHYFVAPLYSGHGECVGGIVCLQDRTEQKHLQARLIAQEKMRALGQLVAGIAHELRNPLTSIKTFVELLPRRLDDARFRGELLRHVPEEVERLNRIVTDLLDYARSQPIKLQAENLAGIVESVLGLFAKRLHDEQVETVVEVPPQLEIRVDRGRIKQVLINLILNALEAMSDSASKTLTIRTERQGASLVLAIADTGAGIDREELPHLFQPFFTTKSQGIGLGLYLSQNIMREHGGEIRVDSRKGEGTTFRLHFPAEALMDAGEQMWQQSGKGEDGDEQAVDH